MSYTQEINMTTQRKPGTPAQIAKEKLHDLKSQSPTPTRAKTAIIPGQSPSKGVRRDHLKTKKLQTTEEDHDEPEYDGASSGVVVTELDEYQPGQPPAAEVFQPAAAIIPIV